MDNKDDILQDFRRKIKRGYPVGELKNELLEKGFSIQEIEALLDIKQGTHKETVDNNSIFDDNGSILKLIGISFLILGLTISSTNFYSPTLGYFLMIVGIIMLVPSILKLVNAESKKKPNNKKPPA